MGFSIMFVFENGGNWLGAQAIGTGDEWLRKLGPQTPSSCSEHRVSSALRVLRTPKGGE